LLAGAEVALALVLLVGGAVLIRSMSAMYRFDPGFDPQQVLTFRVGLPGGEDGTSFIPTADFFQQLTEGLAELPGVMAAGGVTALPLSGRGMSIRYYDGTDENGRFADFHVVTPGYFESVGARLVAGRFVDGSDRQGGRNVVVIDQTLADRVWPNAAAVGRTMRLFSVTSLDPFHMGPTDAEVVGVIQPLMNHDPREDQLPQVYSPHGQVPFQTLSLAVRGETALPSTEAIERTVHALNPALPVADVRPLVSYVDSTFSTTRFVTTLLGTLAVLATLLAAIGVYGVLSYLTAQRTRELGLRLAMGATGQDLARFVVWEGMMPAMGGVAIGVVLAATMGRSLSGLLYGVDPFDVGTVAAVASGLLAISLAACLVPARRAGRTDPMVALRNE
jgi:predicted permease